MNFELKMGRGGFSAQAINARGGEPHPLNRWAGQDSNLGRALARVVYSHVLLAAQVPALIARVLPSPPSQPKTFGADPPLAENPSDN